jgi:hypothetical protein
MLNILILAQPADAAVRTPMSAAPCSVLAPTHVVGRRLVGYPFGDTAVIKGVFLGVRAWSPPV